MLVTFFFWRGGVRRGGEVEIRRRYLSKVKKEMLLKQIKFLFPPPILLPHPNKRKSYT